MKTLKAKGKRVGAIIGAGLDVFAFFLLTFSPLLLKMNKQ